MGGGLGDSGNARKKTFFPVDVFPKTSSDFGDIFCSTSPLIKLGNVNKVAPLFPFFWYHASDNDSLMSHDRGKGSLAGIRRYPDWHAPICGAAPITCSRLLERSLLLAWWVPAWRFWAASAGAQHPTCTCQTPVAAWSPWKFDHLVPKFGKNEFVTKIFMEIIYCEDWGRGGVSKSWGNKEATKWQHGPEK